MGEPNPDDAARKERRREYQHQWYLKNREKALERARQNRADPEKQARNREYQRKWTQENREKVRETKRRWREANPDKVRAQQRQSLDYHRKYYEANRDKWQAQGRRRRHGVDQDTFLAMWEAQEKCCYLCGRELDPAKASVDHWHGCPAHAPDKSCRFCWRGLAHLTCNAVIGQAGDDPVRLRRIADSLEAANRSVQERQLKAPRQLALGELAMPGVG